MCWCKHSWLLSTLVSFWTVCIALISSICVCFPTIQRFHSDLRSVAKSMYPLWCADGNNLSKDAFLSFAQYVFIWEVQLVCGKVQSKTICEHTANPAQAALRWYWSPSGPSAEPLEAPLMWREMWRLPTLPASLRTLLAPPGSGCHKVLFSPASWTGPGEDRPFPS